MTRCSFLFLEKAISLGGRMGQENQFDADGGWTIDRLDNGDFRIAKEDAKWFVTGIGGVYTVDETAKPKK